VAFDGVVSSLEVLNCQSIQAQVSVCACLHIHIYVCMCVCARPRCMTLWYKKVHLYSTFLM